MINDAETTAPDADASGKLIRSPSSTHGSGRSFKTYNYRTDEVRGYLFKRTRDGKWQKRWFETNGCFLTYYKKQGQKLLAALNLPQVGKITLLEENMADGAGMFTIELNERVYTIKVRSHEEAAFWVDALLWRQAGGVITHLSPAARYGSPVHTFQHSPSQVFDEIYQDQNSGDHLTEEIHEESREFYTYRPCCCALQ